MAKVLLVAPTVDGTDVGESWVAYQWAQHLAARHEVTLLTYRKRSRPSCVDQLPNVRVVEWVETPLVGRLERLNSLLKPAYFPFQVRARRWIKNAMAAGEHFDVGHQPLPVAMRYPTPLRGLGIPYVLGPIGGSLQAPRLFDGEDTAPGYMALRRLDGWRLKHDRSLRASYEDAACVLGIAPYVAGPLESLAVRRLEFLPETALEALPVQVQEEVEVGGDARIRLLYVGRLVRTKGARDAISALGLLGDLPVVLDVVGDGFDRLECERIVQELGIGDRVAFHGALPRESVESFYRRADVFVFPSYREPGGNVVFEAMGHGLPLVVSDRGGPGSAVTDDCGIRVTPDSPEQYAAELAVAIRALATDGERRARMGRAARARVESIGLWSSKVDAIDEIYRDIGRSSVG